MAPDRERDPGIAAEAVQTGMVEGDREEEGLPVPVEPDRHHERCTVLAEAGEVHHVLLGEERIELVGRHRERAVLLLGHVTAPSIFSASTRSSSTPSSRRISSVCSANCGARRSTVGRLVELHRVGDELPRRAVGVGDLGDEPFAAHLRIAAELDGVLHRRPLALEGAEAVDPVVVRASTRSPRARSRPPPARSRAASPACSSVRRRSCPRGRGGGRSRPRTSTPGSWRGRGTGRRRSAPAPRRGWSAPRAGCPSIRPATARRWRARCRPASALAHSPTPSSDTSSTDGSPVRSAREERGGDAAGDRHPADRVAVGGAGHAQHAVVVGRLDPGGVATPRPVGGGVVAPARRLRHPGRRRRCPARR